MDSCPLCGQSCGAPEPTVVLGERVCTAHASSFSWIADRSDCCTREVVLPPCYWELAMRGVSPTQADIWINTDDGRKRHPAFNRPIRTDKR